MKNWIKEHKVLVGVLLLVVVGGGMYYLLNKDDTEPANPPVVVDVEPDPIVEPVVQKTDDSFLQNYEILKNTKQELKTKAVDLGNPIKTNNGMPDQWNGFNKKIVSLNSPVAVHSDYYNEETNPKKIDGVYYIRKVEGVPTLFKLESGEDESYEVDIKLPPNSVKHKMISDKYFAYISDVDVDQTGKSVTVVNLENKEDFKIEVSIPEMRIASFFANSDGTKIVIGEEYPPTSGDNYATGDTLNHRVWVYDLEKPDAEPGFIFDQQQDVVERWPIFWAKSDDKIYFNSCDVKDLHCNFGITRTRATSDDREEVEGLEVGEYASQPVLSPNGRHIAFVAWNGNKNTPLYLEGDDINNQFLNKNAIWTLDIQSGSKKKIMDFGDHRIVDHIFWSPDGMYLYYELRQLVKGHDGRVHPTSNSAGFWQLDLKTSVFKRIAPDVTISPGQIISHFTPVADGSGILFTVTKMFPKTTFNDPTKDFENVQFYLRLSDMELIELGNDVMGVFKIDPI